MNQNVHEGASVRRSHEMQQTQDYLDRTTNNIKLSVQKFDSSQAENEIGEKQGQLVMPM